MKNPNSFLTNTTTPAGRANGQAINDPGGNTGTGMDQEIYNDPAYALIAPIESYKDGGISDSNETTLASDMRDTLEEMTEKRVTDSTVPANSVAEWVVTTTYVADGLELVTWKGYQFLNYSDAANLGNDPLLNPDVWMIIPDSKTLLGQHFSGESITGGLSTIADRSNGKFRQYTDYGRYRLGGNGDDFALFSRVALDGTIVTGVAALNDDIFKEGTANEYWNLDLIAPDVLGTRTLIDMGGRVTEDMTSGGVVDTMGAVHDDYMQRIIGSRSNTSSQGAITSSAALNGVFSLGAGGYANVPQGTAVAGNEVDFDSADSTSPNIAKTNDDRTAHAALVTGISYIIVMNVL